MKPSLKDIDRCSHRRCSIKKAFLNIPQISQENICARVSFLIVELVESKDDNNYLTDDDNFKLENTTLKQICCWIHIHQERNFQQTNIKTALRTSKR